MKNSFEDHAETHRLKRIEATQIRQKIAGMTAVERGPYEETIIAYVHALRRWEKGMEPYPRPPVLCKVVRGRVPPKTSRPPQRIAP